MAMSGLAPLKPGLGNWRRLLERLSALCEQAFIVERYAVGGLVLDAVPESAELGAVEHGLARTNRPARVGVLDFQAAGELAQHLYDCRVLFPAYLWNNASFFLECLPERILYPPLRVDIALCLEVFP